MTRSRIKILVEVEYEQQPRHYPEDSRTPEKMLAIDLANADDDPFLFINMDAARMTITGELIEGKS